MDCCASLVSGVSSGFHTVFQSFTRHSVNVLCILKKMSGMRLHKIFSYLRVAQKMKVAHLCLQRPETIVSKFSGARNVLQDSMKDIMETVAEVPLLMHIEASNSVYGFSYVYLEHS